MANCYADGTGTIQLSGPVADATPIIKAIFDPFSLDVTEPAEPHLAYIASLSETATPLWSDIADNLREIYLATPNADEDADCHQWLPALAQAINPAHGLSEAALRAYAEWFDSEEEAGLSDAFDLARALDDGHGLVSAEMTIGFTCDRPRLGEFGGCGTFVSAHVDLNVCASTAQAVGEAVHGAIEAGDIPQAASHLLEHMAALLDSVRGPHAAAVRAAVRAQCESRFAD